MNILLIMSDQHHKNVIGAAGDNIVKTPNLDLLAAEGVQFTNCYAPSPLCAPSRMSFMTSRLPSRNRVWSETPLPSCSPTLAHVMSLAGYETALLGRMHFIGPDQRHGFEKRPIGEFTARYPGTKPKGGKPWQHYPSATAGQFRAGLENSGTGNTIYQYLDEQVTNATCQYLEQKSKDRKRPFFAVAGMVLPHCPYIAPKKLFEYYYDRVTLPKVGEKLPESVQNFRKARDLDHPEISEHRIRVARAAYYALVEVMDQNIGKILNTLDSCGLKDETMVIYTSDHGDMIGEHGCWWKSMYYEGSVGVPFIASGSTINKPGRQSQQLASLLDIGPTLFEFAGAKHIHSNDGMSLLKCLEKNENIIAPNRLVYSEMVDIRRNSSPIASRMIRRGPWKLWQTYDDKGYGQPAMFNLQHDIQEFDDLNRNMKQFFTKQKLLKQLHLGWSPQTDRMTALGLREDLMNVIQKYGRLIEPDCIDTMAFPDDSLEKEVSIIGDDQ